MPGYRDTAGDMYKAALLGLHYDASKSPEEQQDVLAAIDAAHQGIFNYGGGLMQLANGDTVSTPALDDDAERAWNQAASMGGYSGVTAGTPGSPPVPYYNTGPQDWMGGGNMQIRPPGWGPTGWHQELATEYEPPEDQPADQPNQPNQPTNQPNQPPDQPAGPASGGSSQDSERSYRQALDSLLANPTSIDAFNNASNWARVTGHQEDIVRFLRSTGAGDDVINAWRNDTFGPNANDTGTHRPVNDMTYNPQTGRFERNPSPNGGNQTPAPPIQGAPFPGTPPVGAAAQPGGSQFPTTGSLQSSSLSPSGGPLANVLGGIIGTASQGTAGTAGNPAPGLPAGTNLGGQGTAGTAGNPAPGLPTGTNLGGQNTALPLEVQQFALGSGWDPAKSGGLQSLMTDPGSGGDANLPTMGKGYQSQLPEWLKTATPSGPSTESSSSRGSQAMGRMATSATPATAPRRRGFQALMGIG